jgi:Ca-activated chloride channel family protein
VVYAGSSSVVLEPTAGSNKTKIRAAIRSWHMAGGLHGRSGIKLAYQRNRGFIDGGISHVASAGHRLQCRYPATLRSLNWPLTSARRVSLTTLGFNRLLTSS